MKDLKVVEFQGLAPSVFCGMYFADQGANVILISRAVAAQMSLPVHKNVMNRNKHCVELNLKDPQHFQAIKQLLSTADILIDPYRPGTLQKLNLGPKQLHAINPRIILLRVTGYGQNTQWNLRPGHDLNYLSVSGLMPLINKKEQHQFPSNYMADFVSASLGVTGVLGALKEREITGEGKVVDCSLTDGLTYFSQMVKGEPRVQTKAKRISVKGKEYIYTADEGVRMDEIQGVISKMDGDYYCSKDRRIQVSQVKQVRPFDIKSLINPFSAHQIDHFIRLKGQDNQRLLPNLTAKL